MRTVPSPPYPKPAGNELYSEPEKISVDTFNNGGTAEFTFSDYDYQPYIIPNGTITSSRGFKPKDSTVEIDYHGITVTGGERTYQPGKTGFGITFTWTADDGYTCPITLMFNGSQGNDFEQITPTRGASKFSVEESEQILKRLEERRAAKYGDNKHSDIDA